MKNTITSGSNHTTRYVGITIADALLTPDFVDLRNHPRDTGAQIPGPITALGPLSDGSGFYVSVGSGTLRVVASDQLAQILASPAQTPVFTTDARRTLHCLGDNAHLFPQLCCLTMMWGILANQANPSNGKRQKPCEAELWDYLGNLGFGCDLNSGNRTARLHEAHRLLHGQLQAADLLDVYNLEFQLTPITHAMQRAGIAIDRAKMELLKSTWESRKQSALVGLRESLDDSDLNPQNNQELLAALRRKVDSTLQATNQETIKNIEHPAVRHLLEYRGASRLIQAVDWCLDATDANDRIHAHWDALGTSSGRYSCSKPPLQGLPGQQEFLECLVASEGNSFVRVDIAGAELRVLAAASGDAAMIDALQPGGDFHRQTAALALGKAGEDVTDNERQVAKKIIFGLAYGEGAASLAKALSQILGESKDQQFAKRWIDAILAKYPKLRDWREQQRHWAPAAEEARTLGLRRRVLLPKGQEHGSYRFRTLVNHPAQGTIADAIKQAMVYIFHKLPKGAHLVANRHDELIVECPQAEADGVKALLVEAMTNSLAAMVPGVPIEMDAKVANNLAKESTV